MKDLAFVVTVSKGYEAYLPFYIWFNNMAYPDQKHDTIAYCEKGAFKRLEWPLTYLMDKGHNNFEIRVVPFDASRQTGQAFKYYRWLLEDNLYTNYHNLYFGDVDICHVAESPSLLEYHLQHAGRLSLPYSNYVRRSSKRMSGLHFVISTLYYPYIKKVLKTYAREVAIGGILRERNEVMLYRMIKDSGMGLAPYCPKYEINRHHGFHLRVFTKKNLARAEEYYKTESFKYKKSFEEVIRSTSQFYNLFAMLKDKNVLHQFQILFQIAGIKP